MPRNDKRVLADKYAGERCARRTRNPDCREPRQSEDHRPNRGDAVAMAGSRPGSRRGPADAVGTVEPRLPYFARYRRPSGLPPMAGLQALLARLRVVGLTCFRLA